jgi:hypothetical protein
MSLKFVSSRILKGVAGAALVFTAAAHADLVFDEEAAQQPTFTARPAQAPPAQTQVQAQAQAQVQPAPAALPTQFVVQPQPIQMMVSPAPVATQPSASATADAATMPKTELLRRERMREELKNEDALQERLESLRLRDEKDRADKILGADGNAAANAPAAPPAPVVNQMVTAPITENPGNAGKVGEEDTLAASQASATSVADAEAEEHTQITIMPRAGLSTMNADGMMFKVQGRYSAGVGLNVQASSNITFELGYTFNEYGVSAGSSNPYINNLRASMYAAGYGADQSFNETLAMKQNVVDAGMRLYLLNPGAKVRPYVAGGGAYTKSFINYDSQYLSALASTNPEQTRDYESNGFLGYLGAGIDLQVSKAISVGIVGKWYQVLTAKQERDFNNAAFMSYNPYYNPYYNGGYYGASLATADQQDKQGVGGSLARSSFYTVNAGVTFSF